MLGHSDDICSEIKAAYEYVRTCCTISAKDDDARHQHRYGVAVVPVAIGCARLHIGATLTFSVGVMQVSEHSFVSQCRNFNTSAREHEVNEVSSISLVVYGITYTTDNAHGSLNAGPVDD